VPSDFLSLDAGTQQSRSNDLVQDHIREQRLSAIESDRREEEISIISVEGLVSPFQEHSDDGWMKGNRLPACGCFALADMIPNDRLRDEDLHGLETDIGPT